MILNANPIYDAPADLDFADAFNKAKIVAHLGSHLDETGQIFALAHSRGALSGIVVGCARVRRNGFHRAADDRSALRRQDGAPCLAGAARRAHAEPVRCGARDMEAAIKGDFETGWRKALHDGWIEGHGLSRQAQ